MNDTIIDEKNLELSVKIFEKTLGSQIIPVDYEDIPNVISEVLSKVFKQKVKVTGNGLTENMEITL